MKGCFIEVLFQEKKDSCLKSFTFLLRLSFERKFCYLFNKKSVRHFLFCYLLWKIFKSLSPKLLRHRYSECIKAFMVAYWGGGMRDIPQAHTYMCTYKQTHTNTHTHTHTHTYESQTASKLIQIAEYLTSENPNSLIFSSLGV